MSSSTVTVYSTPSVRPSNHSHDDLTLSNTDTGWFQKFDISSCRISPLFTIEKSSHFLFLAALTVSLFIFRAPFNKTFSVPIWIEELEFLIVRVKLFMAFCAVIYWELYRRNFTLKAHGFRLEATRGVFRQVKVAVHLLPHTSFFLKKKSWIDHVFDTSTLSIIPVNADEPIHIPFLKSFRAKQLKQYLSLQADKQLWIDVERQ